jgi:hypothetical protein
MASGGEDAVEDVLNILVSVTEKSGNLRSDLRKDALKAVSILREEFAKLKSEVEDKKKTHCRFGNESYGNQQHAQSVTVWRGLT